MSSEFKPTLIIGRLETGQSEMILHPLHREATLLYQQQVAALIECAREYASDSSDARAVSELLRVAASFTETS